MKTMVSTIGIVLFLSTLSFGEDRLDEPENLARSATVAANSEYSDHYLAKFAVDGVVPPVRSGGADLDHCWCVQNEIAKDYGEFTLSWAEPVPVAEIVYWGRTSFFVSECWKDYQVFFDDQTVPVVEGTFQMIPGPQRIAIPFREAGSQTAKKIRLVFKNSYGGPNPGAAEIMVFAVSPTNAELKRISGDTTPDPPREIAELEPALRDYLLRGLEKFVAVKRFEIEASHVYTYHYEAFRPGGGLYVYDVRDLLNRDPNSSEPVQGTCLVPTPEGQILDADLSYDGKTVLFSWRQKQSEPYHLWTIGVDGTGLKQISHGPWHDYNPCWLPDGDIAFLTSRSPQFAYCWNAPVGVLHRMKPDGTDLVQLSANYLNDFTPTLLADGRIIYGRWEYVDRPAIPIQSLWTIHPDGTNLQVFYGNRVLSPATFMEARQIPGSTRIVCTMTGHNGPTRGAIGILDRGYGVNEQDAIRNITPDIPIQKVDEGSGNDWPIQIYSGPYPLDSERFLVSAKGPILVRTFELDEKNRAPKSVATLLPQPSDGMQYFCATPIRARAVPPVLFSEVLGESQPSWSTIVLQDVYEGLGPEVRRGEVAAVRIVREMQKSVRIEPHLRSFGFQFPTISCGATYAGKMVLGDVPVAQDGSAYFKVGTGVTKEAKGYGDDMPRKEPGDVPELRPSTGPIYFIALDKEGRAIQRMRSFTHLMPGEKQTCVGCHDSRTSSPPSSARLADQTGTEPVAPVLPDWADATAVEPERAVFSPGFDYVRTVQPVWNRYCVDCHNAKESPKGIDLTGDYTEYFNVSYDVLASENQGPGGSPYVSWIPTYNGQEQNILKIKPKEWGSYASPLTELIRNGHPDETGQKRFEMSDEDRRKVYAWIDLNVPYYASSETSHPDLLGCRRIYPADLDAVLNDVGRRRCAECHSQGNVSRRSWIYYTQNQIQFPQEDSDGVVPRRTWIRITRPELNPFLTAPLAKSAGGTQKCGNAVFADKFDPDYLKILRTFDPIDVMLTRQPRIDMPGGVPAQDVCRLTD